MLLFAAKAFHPRLLPESTSHNRFKLSSPRLCFHPLGQPTRYSNHFIFTFVNQSTFMDQFIPVNQGHLSHSASTAAAHASCNVIIAVFPGAYLKYNPAMHLNQTAKNAAQRCLRTWEAFMKGILILPSFFRLFYYLSSTKSVYFHTRFVLSHSMV